MLLVTPPNEGRVLGAWRAEIFMLRVPSVMLAGAAEVVGRDAASNAAARRSIVAVRRK